MDTPKRERGATIFECERRIRNRDGSEAKGWGFYPKEHPTKDIWRLRPESLRMTEPFVFFIEDPAGYLALGVLQVLLPQPGVRNHSQLG